MDFTVEQRGDRKVIRAAGTIEAGDAQKFARVANFATLDARGLRGLYLQSPGGSVQEALSIASLISEFSYVTLVDGDCASACSMILYPAGKHFILTDQGRLGFHQCYNALTNQKLPECTDAIAEIGARRGFPYGSMKLYSSMAEPSEMIWVSNVLAPCYGMEWLPGDSAPNSKTLPCPYAVQTMISSGYREAKNRLGPSFDCGKSSTPEPIEMLLCNDRELMHLDAIMGEVYRMVIGRQTDSNRLNLLQAQRDWIKEREKKCPANSADVATYSASRDVARCVSEQILLRLGVLLDVNGTPLMSLGQLIRREFDRQ